MTAPDDFAFQPETFSGVARLFPLPDLVLFPHVMQPLRVFEPRYRTMLEEALADDGLLAMALLQPGWESNYDGQPPIEPVVCLARVLSHCRLPEGHYNVFLLGLQRATVTCELPFTRPFRCAQVQLLPDRASYSAAEARPVLRRNLLDLFQRLLPADADLQEELEPLLRKQLSLAALTDIVAFTMDFDMGTKQQLLTMPNADQRAQLLVSHLRTLEAATNRKTRRCWFPPEFSRN